MKFEGDIRDISVIETALELAHGGFTGAARFERDDVIKIVYLRDGSFLSASTNDRTDSLDEILLRGSMVSRDHIRQALAKRKDGESLGDALLNLGFITRRELAKARRVQLVGILRSLTAWNEGTYQLVSDYVPKREEGTPFPVPQIIVELLVTSEDRAAAESAMQSGEIVLAPAPGGEGIFSALGLNEDAESVMALVDGERSAAEIAASSPLDAFSVYKLLHAFEVVGIVEPVSDALPVAGQDDDLDWGGEELELGPQDRAEPALPEAAGIAPAAVAGVDFGEDEAGPGEEVATGRQDSLPSSFQRGRIEPSRSKFPIVAGIALLIGAIAGAAWWFLLRTPPAPAVSPDITEDVAVATETAFSEPEDADAIATTMTTMPEVVGDPVADPVAPGPTAALTPVPATESPVATAQPVNVAWSWQVSFVCQAGSAEAARAGGGEGVWSMPVVRDGRSCHRIFWGRFETREAARAARGDLPAYFRGVEPILVSPRSMVR